MNKLDKEGLLFYKTLEQDGIEEIYLGAQKILAPGPKSAPGHQRPATAAGLAVRDQLLALREETLACTKCSELASTRNKVVFGAGNIKADLMFIGEAPGRDEDEQGLPFVGRAGQLLTKIIESIGLSRKSVFIANTLKCRPPGNRTPQPEEMDNCAPFLAKQIELINPKVICALGTSAAHALLKTDETISSLRGSFREFQGRKLICTYHPAYLLRSPGEKRKVWDDMKMIKKELSL